MYKLIYDGSLQVYVWREEKSKMEYYRKLIWGKNSIHVDLMLIIIKSIFRA